jgi:hypothetical protein
MAVLCEEVHAGYDKAINLKALNTAASDGNPAISPSGDFAIFVRDGASIAAECTRRVEHAAKTCRW